MKKVNLFIIGILIIFLISFGVYFYFQNMKKTSKIGPSRPTYCDVNPDDPSCLNLIQCGLLDKDTIKSCENNENLCSSCQCTSDPSVKMNCMTCTPSDGTFEVSVNKDGCQDPFIWNEEQKKCFLKRGKFCLPVNLNPNIPCSSYTGNKVLTQENENSPIQWKCVCKDTTKFANSRDDNGDCVGVNICNMQGKSNPKQITASQRALIKKGSKTTPILWDGKNFNPFDNSECKCLGDEQFDAENMTCKKSQCSPNGVNDPANPQACLCAPGFVSCHVINNLNGVDLNVCAIPSCVPDPCRGLGEESLTNKTVKDNKGGYYCQCDETQGFYPYSNNNSSWGSCVKVCSPRNNPCADRGTCFVMSESLGNITKYDFRYVSNMAKWQIITSYTPPNGTATEYSFNIDNDANLIMTQNTQVFFKIYSGADKTFSKNIRNGLSNNQNYIIQMFRNDNALGYIDFKNLKVVSNLPSTNSNDPESLEKNKNFIFTYTSQSDTDNIGSIKIRYDTENRNNKYIYLNFDGNNLFTLGDIKGTARCKCCKSTGENTGWTQNEDYLCLERCIRDGGDYNAKYSSPKECCSLTEDGDCTSSPGGISVKQFGNGTDLKDFSRNGTIYKCS